MGLDVVVSEIMEQGRKRAEALLSEARAEADRIRREAEDRAAAKAATIRADAEKSAQALTAQGRARADFDGTKRVLLAEKALWDELRADVLAALGSLDEATVRRHLSALAKRAAKEVPQGTARVRDRDVGRVPAPYKATGGLAGAGGMVVESTDGRIRVDLTYETLLEAVWKEVLREEAPRLLPRKE